MGGHLRQEVQRVEHPEVRLVNYLVSCWIKTSPSHIRLIWNSSCTIKPDAPHYLSVSRHVIDCQRTLHETRKQKKTLRTIRQELLVIPGRLVKSKNRYRLNLPKEYHFQRPSSRPCDRSRSSQSRLRPRDLVIRPAGAALQKRRNVGPRSAPQV